jgi:hypothetical protein
MCRHIFNYPEDKPENYNPDGKTLTGVCRCGATQKSYGMRWMIPKYDKFLHDNPFGRSMYEEMI